MPFEQVENYKKRRIRDRLDREKLLMSVERAGLDLKKPRRVGHESRRVIYQ